MLRYLLLVVVMSFRNFVFHFAPASLHVEVIM